MTIPLSSVRLSGPVQPQFGAIHVKKEGIAKSGLGNDAATDLQELAERLNKSRDDNSLVTVLEDVGIDIVIRSSQNEDPLRNDQRDKGNVTVDFVKPGAFEPPTFTTLHTFENEYDPLDKNGKGFLARLYDQASVALLKIKA